MSDVFTRLTQRPGTRRPPDDLDENHPLSERAYQAMVVEPTNKRTPARLKIVSGNGGVGLYSYSFLSEVLCPSPQKMAFFFPHCVVTLEGDHLDGLLERLQEEKVRALICFNPRRHDPVEPGKPIISHIKRRERDLNASGKPASEPLRQGEHVEP